VQAEDGLDRLLMDILKNRALFEDFDRARLAKTLRIDPDATEAGIVQETLALISQDLLKSLGEALLKSTTKGDAERDAGQNLIALSQDAPGEHHMKALSTIFLTKEYAHLSAPKTFTLSLLYSWPITRRPRPTKTCWILMI